MEGMFARRTKAAAGARVPSAVPQLPNLQGQPHVTEAQL